MVEENQNYSQMDNSDLKDGRGPLKPTRWEALGVVLGSLLLCNALMGASRHFIDTHLSLVLFEALLIVPVLVVIRQKGYDASDLFRWRKADPGFIGWGIGLIAAMEVVIDAYDRFIQTLFPLTEEMAELQETLRSMLQTEDPYEFAMIIVGAVFVAGIVEELLFRGFLLRVWETEIDVTQAVLWVAVFFTVAHYIWIFYLWLFLEYLFIGVLLGYVAWKSQSILPSIFMHICHNGFLLCMTNLEPEMPSWYSMGEQTAPWILLAATALMVFCIRRIKQIPVYRRSSVPETD